MLLIQIEFSLEPQDISLQAGLGDFFRNADNWLLRNGPGFAKDRVGWFAILFGIAGVVFSFMFRDFLQGRIGAQAVAHPWRN